MTAADGLAPLGMRRACERVEYSAREATLQVCLTTNKEEFHEMREYREALESTLEQALPEYR